MIVLSFEQLAKIFPSGEKLAFVTSKLCISILCTTVPVFISQIKIVLSLEQVANYFSLGEKITFVIKSVCPSKLCVH